MRWLSAIIAALVVWTAVQAQSRNDVINGRTLDEWVKQLKKSRDPGQIEQAIQAVVRFGTTARDVAGAALIKRLDHHDIAVRVNAALAIGRLGLDSSDVPAGVTALTHRVRSDGQSIVRLYAIMALARLESDADTATSVLLSALSDRSAWELRRAAAYALGRVTYHPRQAPVIPAVRGLTRALSDNCSLVRIEAIMSLAFIGAPPATTTGEAHVARLEETSALRMLIRRDHDKRAVIWAETALVGLQLDTKPGPHVQAIAKFLTNSDGLIRMHAAEALGRLGTLQPAEVRPEIPKLVGMLSDSQAAVADAAVNALAQLKTQIRERELQQLADMSQNGQPAIRARAIRTLGLMGDRATPYVTAMVSLLNDKDPFIASAACLALADLGKVAKAAAIPALNRLVQVAPDSVRAVAFEALKRLNEPAANATNPADKKPVAP